MLPKANKTWTAILLHSLWPPFCFTPSICSGGMSSIKYQADFEAGGLLGSQDFLVMGFFFWPFIG
jgi:hypothetical protein